MSDTLRFEGGRMDGQTMPRAHVQERSEPRVPPVEGLVYITVTEYYREEPEGSGRFVFDHREHS